MSNAAQYWTTTFGHHICALATRLGLSPQEAAPLIASVLGGVAGGGAGLEDASLPRVHPGFSVVFVSERGHRNLRAFQACLGPLGAMQDYMRDVSMRTSRSLADLHKFGLKGGIQGLELLARGKLYDRVLNLWRDGEEDLASGDLIPDHWRQANSLATLEWDGRLVSGRLPGPRHAPTLFHWTSNLTDLEAVLIDSFDQRLLVADAAGDFFRGTFSRSTKQGNAAMRMLATFLAGKEVEAPRFHPDQGHSKFQRAHVNVLAVMSSDQVGEMLHRDANDGSTTLLGQVLLLRPNWQPVRSCGPAHDATALGHYQAILQAILNARIQRSGRGVPLVAGEAEKLAALESRFFQTLDAVPSHLQRFLGAFASLLPRLAWAFKLLRYGDEPDWWLKGVETAADHLLQSHTETLSNAMERNAQCAQERMAVRVVALLRQHGPTGTRQMQRGLYNCRQAELVPVLEKLVAQQRVKFLPARRLYELATTEPAGAGGVRGAVAALPPDESAIREP